jgi:capsular polysaccharide biosynthesis protein
MRSLLPFVWRPKSIISSLAELSLSGQVPGKKEVHPGANGDESANFPLIVAELADGKIIGDLRLAATREDQVIGGIQTVFGCSNLGGHYALNRRRFRFPRRRAGTALLLGAANSDNYYHWLFDSLPRWKMLQAAGWSDYDFVLLHSQPHRFQDETLDWLGVPVAKRLRCSKNFIHQFKRLIVPGMPFPLEKIPPWVCAWLRSLVASGSGGPDKIFLSRREGGGRRLMNEIALEQALRERGFVAVQPALLSVTEQARMLGSARCVVGAHGAALSNLVFAPPGALLLELFHPAHKNRCYANLAAACQHRYASLDGQPIATGSAEKLEYTVDIAAVLAALDSR